MRATYPAVCAILLAVLAPLAAAPPVLEIPAEVRPDSPDYFVLVPKTDAESVVYVGLSGVSPFPSQLLKDPRTFLLPVAGQKPGARLAFAAVAAGKTGEQTRRDFVVLIPGIGPAPGPDPPAPVPPTPQPPDPAALKIRAAIQATGFAKAAALATGYDECAKMAGWATVTTGGDLWAKARDSLKAAMDGGKIPEAVVVAVGAELKGLPAAGSDALTVADRAAAKQVFGRVAALLRAAGGSQ